MASRRGSNKDLERCGHCNKAVTDRDSGVLCEMCESWYHTSCEGISEEVYKVLGKTEALHWFCQKCNSGVLKVLKSVGKMMDKIGEVEAQMLAIQSEARSEIQKLRQSINEMGNTVRNDVEAKLTGEVKKNVEQNVVQFRDIVKEQLEEEMQLRVDDTVRKEVLHQVSGELDDVQETIRESKEHAEMLRMERAEQDDIESRRCNIILYRIPESNEVLAEERRKQDMSVCEQFLFKLNVGVDSEDIRKVLRLGRKSDDVSSPRPILVQLGSRHIKNMVMESLYKIKSMEDKFKSINVSHDMTKKQRAECKALVAEAKQKTENESGDCVYKVRGPPGQLRIVRMRIMN